VRGPLLFFERRPYREELEEAAKHLGS